jgi:hypothetical protein
MRLPWRKRPSTPAIADDPALRERWAARQDQLRVLVEGLGGPGLEFAADLGLGRFWWQTPERRPRVVASTRLLATFARSDSSVLCGWANRSIPPSATVPPVEGIAPRTPDCTETDAWLVAMRIGDAVGAHFLYRAPSPQSSAFLGLWDVRAARDDDAPFEGGSPWPHVREVLTEIAAALDGGRVIDALARGYGGNFVADYPRRGTPLEAPLRAIGERLASLAGQSPEAQRARLVELVAEVARYERS